MMSRKNQDNFVPFMARRSMACTVYQDKIFFFGGVGAHGTESILDVTNDLWSYTPTVGVWECLQHQGISPSPRRCVGFASSEQGITLWGGSGLRKDSSGKETYSFLNDLWLYSPNEKCWHLLQETDDHLRSPKEEPLQLRPEPRYTPVWHTLSSGFFFLFSGYTEDRLGKRKMNDLWLCNPSLLSWEKISGDELLHGYSVSKQWPGVRYGTTSIVHDSIVYIFGGFSDDGDHNDVWMWGLKDRKWQCLSSDCHESINPSPRYCASGAYYDGSFWIFGGRSRSFPKINFNDTWRFDIRSKSWELVVPQCTVNEYGLSAHSIGYHAKSSSAVLDGLWYIWGGEGLHGHVSDLWAFDFNLREWNMKYPARLDDPLFW